MCIVITDKSLCNVCATVITKLECCWIETYKASNTITKITYYSNKFNAVKWCNQVGIQNLHAHL